MVPTKLNDGYMEVGMEVVIESVCEKFVITLQFLGILQDDEYDLRCTNPLNYVSVSIKLEEYWNARVRCSQTDFPVIWHKREERIAARKQIQSKIG